MGEIKYEGAPYAIWSEDMLCKRLDNLISNTKDLTLWLGEDFFFACFFKLNVEKKNSGFLYDGRVFLLS